MIPRIKRVFGNSSLVKVIWCELEMIDARRIRFELKKTLADMEDAGQKYLVLAIRTTDHPNLSMFKDIKTLRNLEWWEKRIFDSFSIMEKHTKAFNASTDWHGVMCLKEK